MNSNEIDYTVGQREAVYRTMLQPIKLSISQILLYDPEAASKFLNEYNAIIKSEDTNMFNRIVELELAIKNYQNIKDQNAQDSHQVQSILQSINDLNTKGYQLSAKELLEAFYNIRNQYKNLRIYSFQDKESIESRFHQLQAVVITRSLKETPEVTLSDIIKEEDISGVHIAINGILSQYLQSEDFKERNKAQKVANMMTESRVIYSEVIWQLIDELQTGMHKSDERIEVEESNNNMSTALTVRKQGTKLSFMEKVRRKFSSQPQLPLQLADLKKIDVDWLIQYIPQEMLIEIEKERLKEEGSSTDKIFIPDIKTPIYDIMEGAILPERNSYEHIKERYSFIDKRDGEEKALTISYAEGDISRIMRDNEVAVEYGDTSHKVIVNDYLGNFDSIVRYAELIDEIFGTNWKSDMLNELAVECMSEEYAISSFRYGTTYKELNKSYKKIYEKYKSERLNFRGSEYKKREYFYNKNKFRASIKQEGDVQVHINEQKEARTSQEREELE